MKINWSFIEPVRDQAARLRGDLPAQSEIVKLAEQQAEIEHLREEITRLREVLEPFARMEDRCLGRHDVDYEYVPISHIRAAAAAIREGGNDE